jgi:hypothetical protein
VQQRPTARTILLTSTASSEPLRFLTRIIVEVTGSGVTTVALTGSLLEYDLKIKTRLRGTHVNGAQHISKMLVN